MSGGLNNEADEIAEINKDVKPRKVPTQEEKFIQSVRALSKKIAKVETEKVPSDQANREISSLIRQVANIIDEGNPTVANPKLDNKALSDIAHDVMEKTRPNPKPATLQEKIVEKYLRENKNVSPKDIDTLRQLAKDVTRLSGDQKLDADFAMQKILNSYEKSTVWGKMQAIRYIAMLLNSGTQAVNAISGPMMATTGSAADVLGTMIDILMNKTLKTQRTTTLYGTNPLAFIARYFKNAKVGGKAGWHGVNPSGIQGTNEIRGLAFPSLKNPLTTIPSLAERTLGAVAKGADYATYKSVFDSEIIKQARLDARKQGIRGNQNIKNHIEQFKNNPPEEAILEADRIGKNTTFQRSDRTGGKIANFLNSAPGVLEVPVKTVFPFVRTPVNIASTAVTLTPGGIIKGLFQLIRHVHAEKAGKLADFKGASQREAIRNLSLGLTGSGIGVLGWYLSHVGIITGANDSGDKDVDAIREQAGKGKYRFNTSALSRYMNSMLNGDGEEAAIKAAKYQQGDKQFDYNKMQPFAFPAAIGASLENNKDQTVGGQIWEASQDSAASLLGMSSLKGLQDTFQPQYGGTQGEKTVGIISRLVESYFKSFSPSAGAQEARRQDPIQRKVPFNDGLIPDVKGYFQSRTPGMSQALPPNKTTLGQNKLNAPGIQGQYINPYKSDVAPYTEAARIISDLIDQTGDTSIAPSVPEKTVTGKDKTGKSVTIPIPQERYLKLHEEVGNEIIKNVTAMKSSLSNEEKIAEIKKIYKDARKNGRDKVKTELGLQVN
ncbi:hypothetical protein [Paenibacillus alginolyticus]|uniref:hypothetical protein n=1 Tax=Paenibacillus alginolyticus TaxID=59839 RepID=UPI001566655A|nr:hypothetical protein [Paenibacillus frigoriresistens]